MTNAHDIQPEQLLARTLAEYIRLPNQYAGIVGVPSEIALRLPGFAAFGIDGERLVEAVRAAGPIMGPGTCRIR
jgi:hypothetical protein